MATRRHTFVIPVAEIAAALLAQPEVVPRAQVIAEWAAELLPDAAAVVYVIRDQEKQQLAKSPSAMSRISITARSELLPRAESSRYLRAPTFNAKISPT
jgi:hypothetical protein